MKKGLTELVFIMDKSGSMSGLEADTIGGYNSMLAKQSTVEGGCFVTTVLFDKTIYLMYIIAIAGQIKIDCEGNVQ